MKTNINIKRIARSYYYENTVEITLSDGEYKICLHYFYSKRSANGADGLYKIKNDAHSCAHLVNRDESNDNGFEKAVYLFIKKMEDFGHTCENKPDFCLDYMDNASIAREAEKAKKAEEQRTKAKKAEEALIRIEVKGGNTNVLSVEEKVHSKYHSRYEIEAIIKDMVAKGIIEAPVEDEGIKKQEPKAEQENTKGIINPYPTNEGIEFVYDDGGQGYFTSWAAMVDFWAKDYNSKAEADKVLRSVAVATILNDGEPICQRKKAGPISAQERSWLIAEAKNRISEGPVEVKDIDAEDANIITSFGNYAFQENGKTVFVANNQFAIDLDNDDEVNALAEEITKFNETLIANGFVVEFIVEKGRESFYYTSMPWDLHNPLVLKASNIEQPTNKTNTSMKYTTTFVGWSVIAQAIAQVLDKDNQFRKFAEFRGLDLYVDGHSISVVNPKNGNSSSYELEAFIQDDTLWLDRIALNIEDFAHYELGEAA